MLTTPKIRARIPLLMTMRQNEVPKDFCDVASLFRFPRTDTPRIIIRTPSVTKPEVGERRGQFRAT